jgi:ABC-type proline/glycine betaine transport system ATPase subunit
VIEKAAGGRLSVREASRLLQLSERQVQCLKRRYRPDSIGWVQHMTTHYIEEAERLCDRVAIVDEGRIIALDTPARLQQQSRDADVRA